MTKKSGMFRYFSFGLRQEWVELFFVMQSHVLYDSPLGPFQKDALRYYLIDMELISPHNQLTNLFDPASIILEAEGPGSSLLWSLFWINLSANAPLFEWWNGKSSGTYSRKEIISQLSDCHGRLNRSISNAYQSLVGTLERTPIGKDLKQGRVHKEGRSRIVIKEGNPELSPFAILYALYKLAQQTHHFRINVNTIEHAALSPQQIFCLKTDKVESLLRSLWLPDLFELQHEGGEVCVRLAEEKTTLDVLDVYIQRL